MSFYNSFTHGMIDATPQAEAARAVHAVCNEARHASADAAMAWMADVTDQAQARLDADQVGQRAYWAVRRGMGV